MTLRCGLVTANVKWKTFRWPLNFNYRRIQPAAIDAITPWNQAFFQIAFCLQIKKARAVRGL